MTKNTLFNHNSIAFRLIMLFIISAFIQCALMSGILLAGGVVQQPKENAFYSFSGDVDNRKNDLENEMNNVWTNFDQYVRLLRRYFTLYPTDADTEKIELALETLAPTLLEMLRTTKTTGVFLILNDRDQGDTHSALYIRNADPNIGVNDSSNLTMEAGPWNVARSLSISTSESWRYRLHLNEKNSAFYSKPYENNIPAVDPHLLAYWSQPFSLVEGEEQIITYSLPLNDENGDPVGVLGVEISAGYLYKFLAGTNSGEYDSYGYMLAVKDGEDGGLRPVFLQGALQKRMIRINEAMELTLKDQKNSVYSLDNSNSKKELYACGKKLGLYYNNTPFETEQWYLLGLMEKDILLKFPNDIIGILLVSFLLSLIGGAAIAFFSAKWFSRPIIELAESVKRRSEGAVREMKKTGLAEIDQLASNIEISQERLVHLSEKLSRIIELTELQFGAFEISHKSNDVFVTSYLLRLLVSSDEEEKRIRADKEFFREKLGCLCRTKSEEEGVFYLADEGGERWLRLIHTSTEDALLGVVIDVTEEMLQTQSLKQERDSDPMTGIGNRIAFNRLIERYNRQNQPGMIGMGIFDLNDLKRVNDYHGHDVGDVYIRTGAALICEAFAGCAVFRIGGDEFATVFVDMEPEEIEKRHALLNELAAGYRGEGLFEVKIAFGYAFREKGSDESMEKLISRADARMYENKKKMKEGRI